MVAFHQQFSEYATCHVCGLKKLCGRIGLHMTCFSCANRNFLGLKNIKTDTQKETLK